MHKEQPRLLCQPVTVKRRYLNPVIAQHLHDRIRVFPKQHEISWDCSFAAPPGRLKINGRRYPQRWRQGHTISCDRLGPRHAGLENSSVHPPAAAKGFFDCFPIDAQGFG